MDGQYAVLVRRADPIGIQRVREDEFAIEVADAVFGVRYSLSRSWRAWTVP